MNINMDSIILYGVAIFSFAMGGLIVSTAMRIPQASSLIPTSLAFTAIMMVSLTIARVVANLTKRIDKIEAAITESMENRL